jgi:hypothetical protein
MASRQSKHLNPNQGSIKLNPDFDVFNTKISSKNVVEVLLNMKESDVTNSFIFKIFGEFDGKSACNPYDIITIPPGFYGTIWGKPNKNTFNTTAGLWVFNKYFIEPNANLFALLGYIDGTINDKMYKKINKKLSYALIEDRINTHDLANYLEKTEKFMVFETILTPNHSEKMLSCTKQLEKRKKELIKKYADGIKAGDPVVAEKMEKELIAYAMEILGDDPSLDTFISGAQGSIDNNFKNMFIMKGAVKDPDPNASQEYNIVTSNYIDGVSPEDYATVANSLAAGPYSRGKKTQNGGYWEKLFVAAFQHIILDPPNSDCGTKRTINITLTDDNVASWMYNYIVSGTKLIELTSDNMDEYIGKTVKFRFSSLCESKTGLCNKCAGNLWYRTDKKNIGLVTPQIASKLKLLCMKGFHDSQVRTTEMDPMKVFGVK